jgi:potassium uptake TrkH family protein
LALLTRWLRGRHPAQLIVFAFAAGVLFGAVLLLLPLATAGDERASLTTALFTSTSALCVTGLVVVDTPTYWSSFGQVVILGLIQVGGIGIMTLASLLALLVARRLGLRTRLIAQAETAAPELQDVRRLVSRVVLLSLSFETVAALLLTLRFWTGYDMSFGSALWHGVFHAISAFNNAGFALWSDSLVQFVTDGWITLTIAGAIIAGGLGFPVWIELRRRILSPHFWTLHTKLTLILTAALLALGFVAVAGFEWSNAATLASLDTPGKLLAAFFQSVTPRTAGFNTIDYGSVQQETLFVTDLLMFIGAGSASTAGGIKVTTFALLFLMVWSEVRGDPNVTAFSRRIPAHSQRQAWSIAFIATLAVAVGTLVLMAVSDSPFRDVLFEAVSAFGTVGLSTGITADWGEFGRIVLIALMFLGRTGPYTLAVALALRERKRLYEFPEERPIIG